MQRTILILTAVCFIAGCGPDRKPKAETDSVPGFTVPVPPAVMTSPEERVRFVAAHYWDGMDFTDAAYIDHPDVTEQAFADYLTVLNVIPAAEGAAAVDRLMEHARADSAMYARFAELAEKYLYDPNSPYRNEELYIPVLRNIIAWDRVDEIYKLRPEAQLKMALKNRVGEVAADFGFTLADGRRMRLHDIKTDLTILFFNNPDCPACAAEMEAIRQSQTLGALQTEGRLKIVAIYPDSDLDAWREHHKSVPAAWIDGYDQGRRIRDSDIYDLRAIPSFYLLDRDKRILIKDAASIHAIEYRLQYYL